MGRWKGVIQHPSKIPISTKTGWKMQVADCDLRSLRKYNESQDNPQNVFNWPVTLRKKQHQIVASIHHFGPGQPCCQNAKIFNLRNQLLFRSLKIDVN